MATPFNLTARLNVQAVNVKPTIDNLRAQLKGLKANVTIAVDKNANTNLKNLNKTLAQTEAHLKSIQASAAAASKSLKTLGSSVKTGAAATQKMTKSASQTNAVLAKTARGAAEVAAEVEEFGRVSGLAIRRFAGFTIATGVIFGFINAVKQGVTEAIKFEREIIRLAQVSGTSVQGMNLLSNEITRLATTLGVASSELVLAARTLKQAGFTAAETRQAMSALAKTDLAPTFNNITQTTEGAIAAMRQFNLTAGQLESTLGSINAVAARFAVESEDIISAIRRSGGVFAAASGNPQNKREAENSLREFIALFTSVRATTRESGESIATGLRTIFTRITRRSTVDALDQLGVKLRTVEGEFVGPFRAIELLSKKLDTLSTKDFRFFQISEQIAGFRQIGKVIPLIKQFKTAQDALKVAEEGRTSLTKDAALAQQALSVQIEKTKQKFEALIRGVTKTTTFKLLAKTVLTMADSLISLGDSLKGVLPALAAFAGVKAVGVLGNFLRGFRRGVTSTGGAGGLGQRVGSGGGSTGNAQVQNTAATQKNTKAVSDATKGERNATKALQAAVKANTSELVKLQGVLKSLILRLGGSGRANLGMGGKAYRKKFAVGGMIPGKGDRDGTPIMAQGGEFMVNRKGVQKAGLGNLIGLNTGGSVMRLASGSSKPVTASDVTRYLGIDNKQARKLVRKGNPQKAEIEARVRKARGDAKEVERQMGVPVLGNSDGSAMLAGFYLRGRPSPLLDSELGSGKILETLTNAGVLPEGTSSFRMPLQNLTPSKKKSDGAVSSIVTNVKRGVAGIAKALGAEEINDSIIRRAISKKGVDVSDAAGKMFEAGLNVGTGVVAEGGKGKKLDFPDPSGVGKMLTFFGDAGSTASYGDAKLTATSSAYKQLRKQFAEFIVETPSLRGNFTKKYNRTEEKALGDLTSMANVALMPGEDVYSPEQVARMGVHSLRKANVAGDRSGISESPSFTVPGSGNRDSYYTQLPEGSFVIRKKNSTGMASGGRVGMAAGDTVSGGNRGDIQKELNLLLAGIKGLTSEGIENFAKKLRVTTEALTQFINDVKQADIGRATGRSLPGSFQGKESRETELAVKQEAEQRVGMRAARRNAEDLGPSYDAARQGHANQAQAQAERDQRYNQAAQAVNPGKKDVELLKRQASGQGGSQKSRVKPEGEAREIRAVATAFKDAGATAYQLKVVLVELAKAQVQGAKKAEKITRINDAFQQAKRVVPAGSSGEAADQPIKGDVLAQIKKRREEDAARIAEQAPQSTAVEKKLVEEDLNAYRRSESEKKGRALAAESPDSRFTSGLEKEALTAREDREKAIEDREKDYSPETRKRLADTRAQKADKELNKQNRTALKTGKGRKGDAARQAYAIALKKGASATDAMTAAQKASAAVVKQQNAAQKKLKQATEYAAVAVKEYGAGSKEAKQAQKELAAAQKREAQSRKRPGLLFGEGKSKSKIGGFLRGAGNKAQGFAQGTQNFFDKPAAGALLLAAPALASQLAGESDTGRGVAGGITGGLAGAAAGAQFGPAGAALGLAAGATSGFINGRQQARLEKAQTAVSDSATEVDDAFQRLSENFKDTTAIDAFNAAIEGAVVAAGNLQNTFSQEEEVFGSLGATVAKLPDIGASILSGLGLGSSAKDPNRGIVGAEAGPLKALQLELNKTFAGINDDLGVFAYALGPTIPLLDKFGAFGEKGDAEKEQRRIVDERNKRRNQETFQALQPAAQGAEKQFAAAITGALGGGVAGGLRDDQLEGFLNKEIQKFTANSENAVQALAALDPKRFEKLEPALNRAREVMSQTADEHGKDSDEAKAAQQAYFDILKKEGAIVAKTKAQEILASERLQDQVEAQTRKLEETAAAIAKVGDSAEDIASRFSMAFEGIGEIGAIAGGGFLGAGAVRNPFEDIANSTGTELRYAVDALSNVAGGTLGGAAARIPADIGQAKIIQNSLLDVVGDALRGSPVGASQEVVAQDALRNDARLKGLNPQTRKFVAAEIGKLFANRQTGNQEALTTALEQTKNLTDRFVKIQEASVESAAKTYKAVIETNAKLAEGFNKIAETTIKANQKFDQAFKLRGQRQLDVARFQGARPGPGATGKLTDDFVKRLTSRAGIAGGTTNPNVIAGTITNLQKQILKDQKTRQEVGSKNVAVFDNLTKRITDNTLKLKDANQALDTLASATDKLNAIQTKLAELQQKRELGRNFLEKLNKAKFDPQARQEINNAIKDAFSFLSGTGSGQSAGGLNVIREILALMGPGASAIGGTNIARQQFAGLGQLPPALRGLLTGTGALSGKGQSKQEQALIGQYQQASNLQIAAINAQGNLASTERKLIVKKLQEVVSAVRTSLGQNLRGRQAGGFIDGPYKGNRDTEVRKMVPGEFVVRRSIAQRYKSQLSSMNAGVPVEEAFEGYAAGGFVSPREHMLNFRKRNVRVRGAQKGLQRKGRLGKASGALALAAQKVINSGGRIGTARAVGEARSELAGQYLDQKNAKAVAYAASKGVTGTVVYKAIKKGVLTGDWKDAKAFMRYFPASPELRVLKDYISGKAAGRNMGAIRDEAWGVAKGLGFVPNRPLATVPGFASGGYVAGVVPGEFVVNRGVTGNNLGFLENLNATGMPDQMGNGEGFRYGGRVPGTYGSTRRTPPRPVTGRSLQDQLPQHLRKYSKPYSQRIKDLKSGKTRGITSGHQVRAVDLKPENVRYSSAQSFRGDSDVQARAEELFAGDRSRLSFAQTEIDAANEKRDKLIASGQMKATQADQERQARDARRVQAQERFAEFEKRGQELNRMRRLAQEAKRYVGLPTGGNPILEDAIGQITESMSAGPGSMEALRVREQLIREGIDKYKAIQANAKAVQKLQSETGAVIPFDLQYANQQQIAEATVKTGGIDPVALSQGRNLYVNKNKQKDFNSYVFRHEYGHLIQKNLGLLDDRRINNILSMAMRSDAVKNNPNIADYQKTSPHEMFANLMATTNNSSIGGFRQMLVREVRDITSGKRKAGSYGQRLSKSRASLDNLVNSEDYTGLEPEAMDILRKAHDYLIFGKDYTGNQTEAFNAIMSSEDPTAKEFARRLRAADPNVAKHFSSFRYGTSMVGNSGMAMLHAGEAVVPARAAPGSENFSTLATHMSSLNSSIQKLVASMNSSGGDAGATNGFAQFATQLAQASANLQKVNIPSTIEVTVAPMQVNVVVNGAEAFANMQEPIRDLVNSEVSKALNNQINPITGETNQTFTQV